MSSYGYNNAVSFLFHLGSPDDWDSGVCRIANLNRRHIPDLIRLAVHNGLLMHPVSDHLLPGSRTPRYAVIHAWKALAELKADAALEPLMALFLDADDTDIIQYLPGFYLSFPTGKVLKVFKYYLREDLDIPGFELIVRIALGLSERSADDRRKVVSFFSYFIEGFRDNSPLLNAFAAEAVIDLQAFGKLPLVMRAFESDAIDESILSRLDFLHEIETLIGAATERQEKKLIELRERLLRNIDARPLFDRAAFLASTPVNPLFRQIETFLEESYLQRLVLDFLLAKHGDAGFAEIIALMNRISFRNSFVRLSDSLRGSNQTIDRTDNNAFWIRLLNIAAAESDPITRLEYNAFSDGERRRASLVVEWRSLLYGTDQPELDFHFLFSAALIAALQRAEAGKLTKRIKEHESRLKTFLERLFETGADADADADDDAMRVIEELQNTPASRGDSFMNILFSAVTIEMLNLLYKINLFPKERLVTALTNGD